MAEITDGKLRIEEEITISRKVDVLVVGGGSAGVGAAICAARNGMDTLLIEQQGCLGGLVTLGLVDYLAGYPEGVGKELLEELKKEDGINQHNICDPEKTKYVLEQMVVKSGSKVLYWTYAIDSIVENGSIKGVIVQNKSGREVILAKRIIDCSGDGDVSAYAGAPFESGWEKMNGYNQAVSLDFVLGNVNLKTFVPKQFYSTIQMKIKEAVKKGELSQLVEKGYVGALGTKSADDTGEVYVCTGHSRKCRTTDADDLTRIAIEQRKQIQELVRFYRKHVVGFENCWLSYTAPLLGVRDSRRIIGEYVFTGEDLVLGRKFPDAVTRDTHGFDIHNPVSQIPHIKHIKLKEPTEPAVCFPDKEGGYNAYLKPGEYYEIPYRCLVPLKVDNLLVAGRCISTTFEGQSGARLIMTCLTMGQAAGTAAALSIKQNVTPRKLDASLLRDRLEEQGINLKEEPPIYVKGGFAHSQPIPSNAKFKVFDTEVNDNIGIDDEE
jgi:hypothetical protein